MKDVKKQDENLLTPKRGAFPTPKSEIEEATPFVPENESVGDKPAWPSSPANPDQEENDSNSKKEQKSS